MLGKIFGAGLGWILGGGPIGAIIGLAIGSALDKGGSSVFGADKNDQKGKQIIQDIINFSKKLSDSISVVFN